MHAFSRAYSRHVGFFLLASDNGGGSGSSPKTLKEQLAEAQSERDQANADLATTKASLQTAVEQKASLEEKLSVTETAKAEAELKAAQAETAKARAEEAQAAADLAKTKAENDAAIAKTKAQEDAAKAGVNPTGNNAPAEQGRKDSGDTSAMSPRERLSAAFQAKL